METKHTQGKWEYVGGDYYSVEINIGESTATLSRLEKNTDVICYERSEMEANAKLIAAAPDLLGACEELISLLKFHGYLHSAEISKAQQAINKAKGE